MAMTAYYPAPVYAQPAYGGDFDYPTLVPAARPAPMYQQPMTYRQPAYPPQSRAPRKDNSKLTPPQALAELEGGNRRFVSQGGVGPNRCMISVQAVADGQKPFAAVLSCADSRVPVEIVFDQGFGDVFVTRVAGNVVTTEIIGSLEFGCAVLGSKVLYVLGHSACGAVKATMDGGEVPGVISSLYYHIKPAVAGASSIEQATVNNVRRQVSQLCVSPVINDLLRKGQLIVAGGIYDLASGTVTRVV